MKNNKNNVVASGVCFYLGSRGEAHCKNTMKNRYLFFRHWSLIKQPSVPKKQLFFAQATSRRFVFRQFIWSKTKLILLTSVPFLASLLAKKRSINHHLSVLILTLSGLFLASDSCLVLAQQSRAHRSSCLPVWRPGEVKLWGEVRKTPKSPRMPVWWAWEGQAPGEVRKTPKSPRMPVWWAWGGQALGGSQENAQIAPYARLVGLGRSSSGGKSGKRPNRPVCPFGGPGEVKLWGEVRKTPKSPRMPVCCLPGRLEGLALTNPWLRSPGDSTG